jgi:hypothetical protein
MTFACAQRHAGAHLPSISLLLNLNTTGTSYVASRLWSPARLRSENPATGTKAVSILCPTQVSHVCSDKKPRSQSPVVIEQQPMHSQWNSTNRSALTNEHDLTASKKKASDCLSDLAIGRLQMRSCMSWNQWRHLSSACIH